MSWSTFDNYTVGPERTAAWAEAVGALREFHDALVQAAPGAELLHRLTSDLEGWTRTLSPMAVPEMERLSGRLGSLPSRGHPVMPPVHIDHAADDRIEGLVTFGAYYLGGGAAAHGGAIMMVLDEVLGMQASAGGRRAARTAYLRTDFRSIVPIDVPIRVRAWFDREDGRKRYLRGDMWAGDTLCAEVEALFVELREGAL